MLVTKRFRFEAAHRLPEYEGDCANLHGHSYVLDVTVAGEVNSDSGMVIDFKHIKKIMRKVVLHRLDHAFLNDIIYNPTAENVIKWIWNTLSPDLKSSLQLYSLRLYETQDCWVELTRGTFFVHD